MTVSHALIGAGLLLVWVSMVRLTRTRLLRDELAAARAEVDQARHAVRLAQQDRELHREHARKAEIAVRDLAQKLKVAEGKRNADADAS